MTDAETEETTRPNLEKKNVSPEEIEKLEAKWSEKHPGERDGSVDAGWRSRKLIVGVVFGGLVVVLSSGLMLVAMTGLLLSGAPEKLVAVLVKFEPLYWWLGILTGLFFTGGCIGLISFDKVIDLLRDGLPILKARYGIKPGPK